MATMTSDRRGGATNNNDNNNDNDNDNGFINNNNNNNGGRSLHNFSLPPCLSWGTHKLLRCSNSTSSLSDVVSLSKRPRPYSPPYPTSCGLNDDFGIHVVREKLLLDLRSEVDKMRAAFLAPLPPRWNLRTPRPVFGPDDSAPTPAPAAAAAEVAPRARFSVALTREEVEEDFVAMVGRRPPRKPKKRPRYIHKELETIFPGVWLSEVTADMYKVNESPEAPK